MRRKTSVAHEDRLVPRESAQDAVTEVDPEGDDAEGEGGVVQGHPEAPPDHVRIFEGLAHEGEGVGGQDGVRMEEEEHVSGGECRAGVEAGGAPPGGDDHPGDLARDGLRPVRAAPV